MLLCLDTVYIWAHTTELATKGIAQEFQMQASRDKYIKKINIDRVLNLICLKRKYLKPAHNFCITKQ